MATAKTAPPCPPEKARREVQLHASCVSLPQGAVLLLGDSGSGKSNLALRLVDGGGQLVADDRVDLVAEQGRLMASAPRPLLGKLEIRGVGILELPAASHMPVALAVDLSSGELPERLPEPAFFDCLGLRVPLLSLHASEGSACAKIRLFLQYGF